MHHLTSHNLRTTLHYLSGHDLTLHHRTLPYLHLQHSTQHYGTLHYPTFRRHTLPYIALANYTNFTYTIAHNVALPFAILQSIASHHLA